MPMVIHTLHDLYPDLYDVSTSAKYHPLLSLPSDMFTYDNHCHHNNFNPGVGGVYCLFNKIDGLSY